MSKHKDTEVKQKLLHFFVLLPAFEAIVSIALIFTAPSEGANARFLGLSVTRWILVSELFILFSLFSGLSWLRFSHPELWSRFDHWLSKHLQSRAYYFCMAGLFIATCISFLTLLLTIKFTDLFVLARLQRIFPIILWIFLFTLQSIVLFPILRQSSSLGRSFPRFYSGWLSSIISICALILIALFVSVTKIGLQADKVGWDNPGVPLLETQMFIALILAGGLYGFFSLIKNKLGWKTQRIDLLVAFLLWLFAVWSWQSQSLTPTFFSPTPRPPNLEFYPYSDAATHDLGAQNLIIGNGFPDILEKPIYSFFLAGLHTLVGQEYQNLVLAQIIVLALFPVVLYVMATKLHHRFSGFILAIAVILREANSIALSGDIRVSHSKLLMTDLPAALGIAALTLLLLWWLQSDSRDSRWLLAIGGALGFLALLRSQTIIFLPALLFLAFFLKWPGSVNRFLRAGLVLSGFAFALFPWLFRNYQINGQFGYSQPLQAAYLAKQYSLTPETGETQFPEGTELSDYVSLGFAHVMKFTLDHPADVIGFVSAHFFHNEISSFLVLPIQFDFTDKLVLFYNLRPYWIGLEGRLWTECCSLETHIAQTSYWKNWDGAFPNQALFPVLINLGLVSIGIGAAWRRVKWLVLVPIFIHVLYNASTAIARVSGWRLILPVDWVLLLLYCLGIGQITLWMWEYLFGTKARKENGSHSQQNPPEKRVNWSQLGIFSAAIVSLAVLLPLSEVIIPDRYKPLRIEEAQKMWDESDLSATQNFNAAEFLKQKKAEILVGRALYPRFYAANEGEPGGDFSVFNALPFSRMAFSLVGPQGSYQIALPLDITPVVFINASDVVVIGCVENDYFRAVSVLFIEDSFSDLITDGSNSFSCLQ